MGKLEQFKSRAAAHGQTITLYPFLANPAGTFVDVPSGYPDPESGTYPATVPAVTYGTAVSLMGFVQAIPMAEGGESYVKTAQGENVPVDMLAYMPGDQAVTVRDKLVIDGVSYEVLQIREFKDGATVVMKRVELQKIQE